MSLNIESNGNYYQILEYLNYQNCEAWNKVDDFMKKYSGTTSNFSIDTLIEEFKPINTENNEFDYPEESKMLALFDIWDCQESDAKLKKNETFLKRFSSPAMFLIEKLMKKIEPVLRGNMSSIMELKQFQSHFWNFRTTRVLMERFWRNSFQ